MGNPLESYRKRFAQAAQPEVAWQAFEGMYHRYRSGADHTVAWGEVSPPRDGDLIGHRELVEEGFGAQGRDRLGRVAWIVLNGGIGTSMKMDRAKSLLPVRGDLTFLDLIVGFALKMRVRHGVDVPLAFMNSFATKNETLAALKPYEAKGFAVRARGGGALPVDFTQHRFPRIVEADDRPFGAPDDPRAWAPPGHGDLYPALVGSGMCEALRDHGVRWVFVSNADNLGAAVDPAILGYMAANGLEFVMEVTPKTAADVKGGTLVRRSGRLELLEIAQVAETDRESFQDTRQFPAFNTNNLWFDLEALAARMEGGVMALPLIVNRKRVDDTPVVQLETAMGAAIGVFDKAAGVLVDRSRFAPVKTTNDLVVRRSDLYEQGHDAPLAPSPRRDPALGPVVVRLDPAFYGSVPDLDARISAPLGLMEARNLTVTGDVRFGRGVTIRGDVHIEQQGETPCHIDDGAILEG